MLSNTRQPLNSGIDGEREPQSEETPNFNKAGIILSYLKLYLFSFI